eukprot:scpid71830/ scgid26874/ Golgi resident protein GCP60; Acyl-CoA-binding domain-containing protein 3; Golgi complex-associated protein 1; Golgi phosphoprotein 1; PBR- and PKA-associated protein 7; Peripheral benzodiazepine receptor-associated protein PAP7
MSKNGLSKQDSDPFLTRYGLTCEEAYPVALALYRKERDYLELTYGDKNNLSAFYKQATYGGFQPEKAPTSGWLDFVGNDRRKAWEQLGTLSTSAAKAGFCQLMLKTSGKSFEAAMMKAKRDKFNRMERERVAQREAERKKREEAEAKKNDSSNVTLLSHHEEELEKERNQRASVYEQQQNVLQKQHEGVKVDLAPAPAAVARNSSTPTTTESSSPTSAGNHCVKSTAQASQAALSTGSTGNGSVTRGNQEVPPALLASAAAAIWTRPGVKEFTESTECKNVTVNRSDTLYIRVPIETLSHSVFWQFATVDYDISFAVDFYPGQLPAEEKNAFDPKNRILEPRRVNSHEEVICGSHKPTQPGYYVLHFDNTYSYLRSKSIYFHVYCAP